jgi:hypothetical protein
VINEIGVKFVKFTNQSPLFKGETTLLVGLIALAFAWWMRKRWQEPLEWRFLLFIGVASFITLYGIFVLIFQPQWWKLPY